MSSHWTAEQQQAITSSGKSLLLAAAAGSGKTAVLVERIIQKIINPQQPVAIDELLIVTFTNAAAGEMRERIGAALNEALKRHPDSAYLYEQTLLLNKAQITTLHSFCLELIRSHFFLLDIAPNVKIANEVESALLKQEALTELLEEFYGDETKAARFTHLADCYGGREDEGIAKLILRLYTQSMSLPQPEEWLYSLPERLQAISWTEQFLPIARQSLQESCDLLAQAIELAEGDEGLDGYHTHLSEEYDILNTIVKHSAAWNELVEKLEIYGDFWDRLPSVKKGSCDEAIKEQVVFYRDEAKKRYKKQLTIIGRRRADEIAAEIAEQSLYTAQLAEVTLAFKERYQQLKQSRELIDFDDMEHLALKLLYTEDEQGERVFSPLSQQLKAQYHEVLVDEYQDINDLQENILQAVSREDNLFMVGDVKQSIYGFRMANPQLFLHKYQTFPVAEDDICQRIDLNRNFRCRETIIQAVNDVFAQLMLGTSGDLLYDEQAALVYGADYPLAQQSLAGEKAQLILLERQAADEEEPEESEEKELSAAAKEARIAAEEINGLLMEGTLIWDKNLSCYRKATYRDIVILLRSPKSIGEELVQQLEIQGIPCHIDSSEGYFSAWEIQILLALLSIIDNPLQDVPLAAVLRAPFFGFDEEELVFLRLLDRESAFYQTLLLAETSELSASLKEKTVAFLEQLDAWRTMARLEETSALVWQIYKDTGFYDYVGALPHGAQRQANLRALHERAKQYEMTSYSGLFMFLRFIDQMNQNQQDLEPAKLISDSENVVRIMSIHKSKGLEFPIVLLLGANKKFNMSDINQDIILDKELGLALPVVKLDINLTYPTICQQVIKDKLFKTMLTEEKRVLYVAFTRAREKLIVIASEKNIAEKVTCCPAKPPQRAASYLQWLLPVVVSQQNQPDSHWQMRIVSDEFSAPEEESLSEEVVLDKERIKNGQLLTTSGKYQTLIAQQLNWQYPYLAASLISSKVSVTEIKCYYAPQLDQETKISKAYGFTRRPLCVQAKSHLSAAEKGTLIHLFMRHVDLSRVITMDYLLELAAHLEVEEFIAQGLVEQIDLSVVERFFATPLGKRMQHEKIVYRELPLTMAIDSHLAEKNLPPNTKPVIVQGIIDCIWEEEDGFVLIDYKSDHIGEKDVVDFIEEYGGQVELYAKAVEKIWHKPVKEKYIFFFAINRYVAL